MSIYIIEGPDGGGKSTLAQQLCARFNCRYAHEGPPPPHVDVLAYYGKILDAARGQNVVFDRLALGERVYGPILRGIDRLGEEGWFVFQRLISAVGAVQIVCLPDRETCRTNWRAKDDLIKDDKTFDAVYDRYVELIPGDAYKYVYNWSIINDGSFPAQYDSHVLGPGMVGSPRARVLFVGDRGKGPVDAIDLPFFGVSNSSLYLNRALRAARISEHDIAFINAYPMRDGPPNILPTNFLRVIALGKNAYDACKVQGIEALAVPHPQFWRRFRFAGVQEYAALLGQVARL